MMRSSILRSAWLPIAVSVAALFAWSLHSYLTVWVDADIVAEAIAVQRWLADPGIVLTYPGQRYGGIVEYPLIALAETVSPGNPFGFTLIRVLYLPIVGLMTALSVRALFPKVSLWPFAVAAALGPAVVHGMMPIKDLYPMSWVLGSVGMWLIVSTLIRSRSLWLAGLGGALVGLAAYEHPTSLLLTVPMLVAIASTRRASVRTIAAAALGAIPGFALLVIAAITADPTTIVYDPASAADANPWAAFGLAFDPNAWARAMVPNGWGVQSTDLNDLALSPLAQLVVNSWLLGALVLASVVLIARVVRRSAFDDAEGTAFLGAIWLAVVVEVIVLASVIPANFFYGAAIAPLVWVSITLMPRAMPRSVAWPSTALVMALMAVTTIGTFMALQPKLAEAAWFKQQRTQAVADVANAVKSVGIDIVVGDYWETLPIAHAAGHELHVITPGSDRFPLPLELRDTPQLVAVSDGRVALPIGLGEWPGSPAVVSLVESECTPADVAATLPEGFRAFRCTPDDLMRTR